MHKKETIIAVMAVILTVVFWSSAYVGIRIGITSFSAGALGLFRYFIAAVIMGVVYYFLPNKNRIKLKDGLLIFLTGAVGIGLYNVSLNEGETTVIAAVAGFLISMIPVVTVVVARFFLNEYLSGLAWFGIAVSVSGVLIISLFQHTGHFSFTLGVLYIIVATFCGGFYSLMQKHLLKRYGPVELVCLSIISGAIAQIVFLPELIHELPVASMRSIGAVIYLGIFPAAIAYLSFSIALKHLPIVRVTPMLFAMPFLTLLLGWLVLGETLNMWGFIGGIITLIGPIVVQLSRKKRSQIVEINVSG